MSEDNSFEYETRVSVKLCAALVIILGVGGWVAYLGWQSDQALLIYMRFMSPIFASVISICTYLSLKAIAEKSNNNLSFTLLVVGIIPFVLALFWALLASWVFQSIYLNTLSPSILMFLAYVIFDREARKVTKGTSLEDKISEMMRYVDFPTLLSLFVFLVLCVAVDFANEDTKKVEIFCYGGMFFQLALSGFVIACALPEHLIFWKHVVAKEEQSGS